VIISDVLPSNDKRLFRSLEGIDPLIALDIYQTEKLGDAISRCEVDKNLG
jgi:hypothetical protein